MSVLIVIPARYASTRYPGKPLVMLRGAMGEEKSLIQRSWEAACQVGGVDKVVIATDDDRIREHAEGFGAEVVMTSPDCLNGTERCAEAQGHLAMAYDTVVNFQGDAPLTPPWFVEKLIDELDGSGQEMATPVLRCDGRSLNGFLNDRKNGRVGGTTAVFDHEKRALYFSKEVVPFTSKHYAEDEKTPVFHHVGVYAYKAEALADYNAWQVSELETLEGLEQLRFLAYGSDILCVEVDAKGRQFWELNNPEDVPRIEAMLAEMGVA